MKKRIQMVLDAAGKAIFEALHVASSVQTIDMSDCDLLEEYFGVR